MSYILDTTQIINMPQYSENSVTEELLSNYTYGRKWNVMYHAKENCITIGNYTKADYGNSEYVINVTDDGIYIGGFDFSATMRGFLTFLEKIKYSAKEDFFVKKFVVLISNPLI